MVTILCHRRGHAIIQFENVCHNRKGNTKLKAVVRHTNPPPIATQLGSINQPKFQIKFTLQIDFT